MNDLGADVAVVKSALWSPTMNRALATVVLALGASTLACVDQSEAKKSGPDSGASSTDSGAVTGDACPSFTACGGDIVGTWRVTTTCASEQSSSWCAEVVTIDRSGAQMDYTFASDGTFTIAYSGTIRESVQYPFRCISAGDAGPAETCAGLQEMAQKTMHADAGTAGFTPTAFACRVDATGCLCDEVLELTATTTINTYSTHDNQLVAWTATDAAAPDTGGAPAAEYCVSGNTLAIHWHESNGSSGTTWYVKR
jgi:hypothetical protein